MSDDVSPDPKTIPQPLWEQWRKYSEDLLSWSGEHISQLGGGWSIVDKPALKEIIDEAAVAYLPLAVEKIQLMDQLEQLKFKQSSADDSAKIQQAMNRVDRRLVSATESVVSRLEDSGEFRAEVIRRFGNISMFDSNMKDLIGPVVHRVALAANHHLSKNGLIKLDQMTKVVPFETNVREYDGKHPVSNISLVNDVAGYGGKDSGVVLQ